MKALPASTKLVAASCLLCSCRWSCAAWQKALPAAAGGGECQARGAAGGWVGMGGVRLRPPRPGPHLPLQFLAILNMLAARA